MCKYSFDTFFQRLYHRYSCIYCIFRIIFKQPESIFQLGRCFMPHANEQITAVKNVAVLLSHCKLCI